MYRKHVLLLSNKRKTYTINKNLKPTRKWGESEGESKGESKGKIAADFENGNMNNVGLRVF